MSIITPAPVVKKCRCGQCFTMKQWNALELCGYQDYEVDGDKGLELRNCFCGSTIGILRTPSQREASC